MSKIKVLVMVAALATALSPAAQAVELINNGGFEANPFQGAGFMTFSSGLSGWSISGSVDLIKDYWAPASGSYSLDLNGGGASTISQAFATQIGMTYNVSFSMAGNPDGGGNKSINASVTTPNTYTFDISNSTHANMGWVTKTFSFVATSNSSTLSFVGDAANGPYGAALDNVSVSAVPEPATYAMMLAGLSLMGYVARNRRHGAGK
jgi:choice-of-anchor C domain-containing protein